MKASIYGVNLALIKETCKPADIAQKKPSESKSLRSRIGRKMPSERNPAAVMLKLDEVAPNSMPGERRDETTATWRRIETKMGYDVDFALDELVDRLLDYIIRVNQEVNGFTRWRSGVVP